MQLRIIKKSINFSSTFFKLRFLTRLANMISLNSEKLLKLCRNFGNNLKPKLLPMFLYSNLPNIKDTE